MYIEEPIQMETIVYYLQLIMLTITRFTVLTVWYQHEHNRARV